VEETGGRRGVARDKGWQVYRKQERRRWEEG